MKVLFATTNPAKIESYASIFTGTDYEILTLADVGINIDVDESGNNPEENAIIKAVEYGKISNCVTITLDCGLFFEGIKSELQPGTNVRRVNGKRLTDTEMIDYYSSLINTIGTETIGYWLHSYCVYNNGKHYIYSRKKEYTFKSTPSKIIREGYPLDSLVYLSEYNKYLSEIDKNIFNNSKKNNIDDVAEFMINTLNKIREDSYEEVFNN